MGRKRKAAQRTTGLKKRRDSSDIEERATRIFQNQLPDTCIVNQEAQDKQHLDYTVHLRESGRPSGIQFGVQVKGLASSRGTRRVSKKVKRAHLEYWLERSRLPVFIVLVDIEREEAYFISVRAWERSHGSGWKRQASTTVHIPRSNRLGDHTAFISAIRHADLEQQQSAPRHALSTYTGIDGRFAYELSHRSTGENVVTLRALEPVELTVTARGSDAVSLFEHVLKTGQPQEFRTSDLEFNGGPIFDYMQAQSDGSFRFQLVAERDCHLAVIVEDEHGQRTRALEGLRGRTEGGLERVQYKTRLRDAPLGISGTFADSNTPNEHRGEARLTIDFSAWLGHPLPYLPGLALILRFAEALRCARRTFFAFAIDGIPIDPPIELDPEIAKRLSSQISEAIQLYRCLSEAAEKLGVKPKLPDLAALPDAALEQLGVLLRLCAGEEIVTEISVQELSADMEVLEGFESRAKDQIRAGRLMVLQRMRAELFGQCSEEYVLLRSVGPLTHLGTQEPRIENGRVQLRLQSAEGAQARYQLRPQEEASRAFAATSVERPELVGAGGVANTADSSA